MKDLNIQIQGKTVEDLELALQEVSRLVSEGFTEGFDRNEDARYSFSILEKQENNELPTFNRTMTLCPKCGNKRCPHATNSNYECTNSNEPGQPGSAF